MVGYTIKRKKERRRMKEGKTRQEMECFVKRKKGRRDGRGTGRGKVN